MRNFAASAPSVRAARGRSLEISWLCRLRVAVEITTGVSLRKLHCTAGTRYASDLPTPVPASTIRCSRASKARVTARVISS